jgi:TPR repeat protein
MNVPPSNHTRQHRLLSAFATFGLGRGVDRNLERVVEYYERASNHSDREGTNHFRLCLEFREGELSTMTLLGLLSVIGRLWILGTLGHKLL